MTVMRHADVVARVAAWHNRHPLARRIGRANVGGIGVVALPFALPGREPGQPDGARRAAALSPLFGDDWMFRLSQGLGTWSQRHGVYPLPGYEHWPLRQIDAELALAHAADAAGLTGRTVRHLLTAVVDAGGRRTRVLLSPQGDPRCAAVFGQRLLALPRVAGLATMGAAAAAAWAVTALPPLWNPPSSVPVAAATTDGASSAPTIAAPASEPAASAADAPDLAAVEASAPAHEAQHPASAASAAPLTNETLPGPVVTAESAPTRTSPPAPPPDTEAVLRPHDDGAAPLVRLRPQLSAEQREAARRASHALRATTSAPPDAAVPTGPVYAIASRPIRSRDEARALQALMQGLQAQSVTAGPTRLDVMEARGQWRVVWWPHPQKADAQALLDQARARGLVVELIRF